jgi:glycosyltransferase involved in cell wall biosynthesis
LNDSPSGPRRRFGIDRHIAQALNASAGAVALSSHVRRTMEGMGVAPGKIIDIPNGVESARFRLPVSFDLRSRFGIPKGSRVVLSVGRESWAKDYEMGIRAFVRAAGGDPDVYYLILGKGVRKWEHLKAELPEAAHVILCEGLHGDELVGAYQQADVFFLPSVKETFPLVVVEAMAAGLPEVVTDVSGSQDAIKDQENGLVVPPGDVEAAASALRKLLDDQSLGKRLGAANRERAALYDWGRISRMYLDRVPDVLPTAGDRMSAHTRRAW